MEGTSGRVMIPHEGNCMFCGRWLCKGLPGLGSRGHPRSTFTSENSEPPPRAPPGASATDEGSDRGRKLRGTNYYV